MRCVEPFVKAGEVYPCGRCLPCKFRSRRIWFHRILLEASQHDYNSVVTLTYDESSLPALETLYPPHLRDWLKRYRKRSLERYPWRFLRFYAVGEYGEKSGRPHYHVLLFGAPGCENGRSGRAWCSGCECVTCSDLMDTWRKGEVSVDRFSRESAAYVAGYVTRKVLAKSTGMRLSPFFRMSNGSRGLGGIGASAMHDVASTVLQYNLPVPGVLGHGRRPMLLGRYLRRKLSEYTAKEIISQPSEVVRLVSSYSYARGISARSVFRTLNEVYASQLEQREAVREKVL